AGDPSGRPLGERGRAGVLHRVLGHFEVAHQAGDGRYRRPPVGAEHLVVLRAQPGTSAALSGICTTGRTSTEPLKAVATAAAHRTAASRPAQPASVPAADEPWSSAAGASVSSRAPP